MSFRRTTDPSESKDYGQNQSMVVVWWKTCKYYCNHWNFVLGSLIEKINQFDCWFYFCAIVLAILCVWNVQDILVDYFKYETRIDIDRELPDYTDFPGITVCARAIFTPKHLADLYPDFNRSYHQFLQDYHRDPLVNTTPARQRRYQLFRIYENIALTKFDGFKVITEQSLNLSELVRWCHFKPINIHRCCLNINDSAKVQQEPVFDCDQIKKPIPIVYDGQKCFTYFSDLNDILPEWKDYQPPKDIDDLFHITNHHHHHHRQQHGAQITTLWPFWEDIKPQVINGTTEVRFILVFFKDQTANIRKEDLKRMKFVLNPHIMMQINMHNNIWDFIGDNGFTTITVHPPNRLYNRRKSRSFQVQRSSYYEVSFTKQITKKLPKPFKTACINYQDDTVYSQYRTQDMCNNICIKEFAYTLDDCINYYMALSARMFNKGGDAEYICDHDYQNYTTYLSAENHCRYECPAECLETVFELNGRIDPVMNTDHRWPLVDDPDTHTIVLVKISPVPFSKTVHQPEISYEKLTGTLGGHLGIWLGLSIYSLVKFCVHFLFAINRKFVKFMFY